MLYNLRRYQDGYLLLEATIALALFSMSMLYVALYCYRSDQCFQMLIGGETILEKVHVFFDEPIEADLNAQSDIFCECKPAIIIAGKKLYPLLYTVTSNIKKEPILFVSVDRKKIN